jgi:metallo-beta-lactamase class B
LPGVFTSAALELVYLIKCGDRSVLVDTGFLHNCDAHLANFSAAGIDLETIDAIFTTHFHVDHTAGLAHARKRLRCPVFAHKNNVPIIETGDRAATAAEMPYIAGWRFPYPPCKVDEVIEDGDDITVGSLAFRVVHLPGHTPGCTGYLWDGNLITGDVVFPGGSLGWNDVHWGSNYLDVIDTVKRIADLNPKYLLPTHTAPFPYDPSVTTNAQQGAREMLEGGRSGPIAYTQRAAR